MPFNRVKIMKFRKLISLMIVVTSSLAAEAGFAGLFNPYLVLNPNNQEHADYGAGSFAGTLFSIGQGQTLLIGGEISSGPGLGASTGHASVRINHSAASNNDPSQHGGFIANY